MHGFKLIHANKRGKNLDLRELPDIDWSQNASMVKDNFFVWIACILLGFLPWLPIPWAASPLEATVETDY